MHVSVRHGVTTLAAGLALGIVPGVVMNTADAAAPTAISLHADHSVVTAGNRLTLLAHINVSGATVSFWRTYRGQHPSVIYRGKTDSHGYLRVGGPVAYSASYTVTFAGTTKLAPSRARPVSVAARVRMAIATAGGSKKHGYRSYKASKKAKVAAATGPSKAGHKVLFRLQVRKGSHYRTVDTRRYSLGKNGTVATTYRGKAGHRYRVRAEYAGDSLNAANHTAWVYSRFH